MLTILVNSRDIENFTSFEQKASLSNYECLWNLRNALWKETTKREATEIFKSDDSNNVHSDRRNLMLFESNGLALLECLRHASV